VGLDGTLLIHELRSLLPSLPVLYLAYLANSGRSTPEMERRLPPDVPILREPFSADQLLAAVRLLLPKKTDRSTYGGMLPHSHVAWRAEQSGGSAAPI
jgi:hypothetical protein